MLPRQNSSIWPIRRVHLETNLCQHGLQKQKMIKDVSSKTPRKTEKLMSQSVRLHECQRIGLMAKLQ